MQRFEELLQECHTGERHAIEDLLLRAAEFVHAEAVANVLAMNITERNDAEQKEKYLSANRARVVSLDGIVYAVHVVNRICAKHGKPLIYQGEINHQGCAEIAMQLFESAERKEEFKGSIC